MLVGGDRGSSRDWQGLGREAIHPSTNPNHGLMVETALAGDEKTVASPEDID